MFGCDSAMQRRGPAPISAARASAAKSAGSRRMVTVRPSACRGRGTARRGRLARAARAGCSARRRRWARGAHVVVRCRGRCRLDDALHQLLRVADLLEHERDIQRRPARDARALAVDAVLADHRQRVGQQVERHRQPPARRPHHRLVDFERVAVLVEGGLTSALPRRLRRPDLDAAGQAARRMAIRSDDRLAPRPPARAPIPTWCSTARRTRC